jgi:hypothetical protein
LAEPQDICFAEGCGQIPGTAPRLTPNSPATAGISAARVLTIADLAPANLKTQVPGGRLVLLALLFAGTGLGAFQEPRRRGLWPVLAGSILVSELLLRCFAEPDSGLATVLLQIRRANTWILLAWGAVMARRGWQSRHAAGPLILALVVPWITLLVLTETDKPERMIGVWPLQVLFISAFVMSAFARLSWPPPLRWAVLLLAIALSAANSDVLNRVRNWRDAGWSGARTGDVAQDYPHVLCE